MLISIIIPCYNEEDRISATLEAISRYVQSRRDNDFEIIVVDNGSKDKTRQVALSFEDKLPGIRIIDESSYGKGWAVKQGMLAAKGEYRLFMDADNSTDIGHLDSLLDAAKTGADIVISSRRLPRSHIVHPQPWHRRMLGDAFSLLVRAIVPLGVKDTQNGFKLFSAEAAEKIFSHQTIFYWAFDVEILAIAKRFGFRIEEVPVTWINDEGSKMNIKGMMRMLLEVIIIRLNLLSQQYSKA